MKFSIPFLSYHLDQLPLPGTYENQCVEAIIFNREDLEQPKWDLVWKGVKTAVSYYQSENVSFHFPVNHSDYVADPFVKDRLIETLERASELGIAGIVVHSNRVSPLRNWAGVNLEIERTKVIDALVEVRSRSSSPTWLALENMPVMDNYGIEVDPLFVYPEDFKELRKTDVKVVFDICHFSNTQANIQQVLSGKQSQKHYPSIRSVGDFDFLSIEDLVVHWHFSSFFGVANPDTREICKEGVVPSEGSLGESYYKEAFQKIVQVAAPSMHMVFEIQETDYKNRLEVGKMLKWAYSLLIFLVIMFNPSQLEASWCVALNAKTNTLSFIEFGGLMTCHSQMEVGLGPKECTWDDKNELLYVSNALGNRVTCVDFKKKSLHHSEPIFRDPRGLLLSKDRNFIYVISKEDDSVFQIATKDFQVCNQYRVGRGPRNIGIDTESGTLFITNNEDHSLSIIDLSQPQKSVTFPLCQMPYGLTVDSKRKMAYITSIGEDAIYLYDYLSREIKGKIGVGKHPTKLTLDDERGLLYVACLEENAVYVVDLLSRTVIQKLNVGPSPFGIDLNRERNRLVITCNGDDTLQYIDLVTGRVIETVKIGKDPHSVIFIF